MRSLVSSAAVFAIALHSSRVVADPGGPYEMVTVIHRDDGGKDSTDTFDLKRVP
jgi:hypothetical protein